MERNIKLSTQRLLLHHTVLEALVYRVVKELMANLLIFRHLPMIRNLLLHLTLIHRACHRLAIPGWHRHH